MALINYPDQIPQGTIQKRGGQGSFGTVYEILGAGADCGCGLDCACYGFLVLPNWDTTTNDVNGYRAIYFKDGVMTVDTVPNARADIDSIKSGS